jgi:hypothetical protein
MQLRRIRWALALAALVLLAAPAVAQANEVTHWNRIATDTLVAIPGPASGAPSALQVNLAMPQGAVYDAVNAIEPRHRPYLLGTPFTPTASKDAAAATAAYRVLTSILSTVPATIPFPNRAALLQNVANEYAASLAAIPAGASKDAGIAAGNAAADAMIAARQNDGRFGPSQWGQQVGAGYWQPLIDPVTGLPQLDPTPWVGGVLPFLLRSGSQFRTRGPNALRSRAWVKDYNEVKALGRADSSVRTDEQTHIAIFWQSAGGPALLWNSVARDLAETRGLDLGDSALLFAMLNLSGADASINAWNDKYYWDFWRPWNAIHGDDGNPATLPDPTWTALLTAPYPDHPSGHLSLDGAMLNAMRDFFGKNKMRFGVVSSRFPGDTRYYERFSEPLKEITEARIWAGLHYRTADEQAKDLGQNVTRYMTKHYFQRLH